jgi:glutathione S-transferase
MRARLAIRASGERVALREIVLRHKPAAFLAVAEKATVPVLQTNGAVIAESRDIMLWALHRRDPEGWLRMPDAGHALIDDCDGPFKAALDHTKYAVRFPERETARDRDAAGAFIARLDRQLDGMPYLFGPTCTLADMAILPFVRQFAAIDRSWFDEQGWIHVRRWLDAFLASDSLAGVMRKYPPWQDGQDAVMFPV